MAENNASEMRKKLLDIQNELLKGSNEMHEAQYKTPSPSTPAHHTHELSQNDLISILKDLRSNQQKILSMLSEINNKIR